MEVRLFADRKEPLQRRSFEKLDPLMRKVRERYADHLAAEESTLLDRAVELRNNIFHLTIV